MDTYSMQVGYAVPEIVTGKPIALGGSLFRHEATGAGVVMVTERACQRLGWNLAAPQKCNSSPVTKNRSRNCPDGAKDISPGQARPGAIRKRQ
jgi:hypothetical protein